MHSIQRVELHGFRAFERFSLPLRGDSYLAGPNNAGKSTLIGALRVAAQMILALARQFSESEVPGEMVRFLDRVEAALEEAGVPSVVS
jgi:predicted ATP-dependent endonuclease of OLD family